MPASKARRSRSSRRWPHRVIALESVPAHRMRWVFAILCFGLIGLVGRMAWLQVLQAPELEARARALQTQRTQPIGIRRSIVDRTGRLVALDEQHFRLWAHPRYFNFPGDDPGLIRKPIDVASKLSGLLSIPMAELAQRLVDRD